eukprot:gene2874-3464_t
MPVQIVGDNGGPDLAQASKDLCDALHIRCRYVSGTFSGSAVPGGHESLDFTNGVFTFGGGDSSAAPTYTDYVTHLRRVEEVAHAGPCRSATKTRLGILRHKMSMHKILNAEQECADPHFGGGDVYSAMKVDSCVWLPFCANAQDAVIFIGDRVANHSHDVVSSLRGGGP